MPSAAKYAQIELTQRYVSSVRSQLQLEAMNGIILYVLSVLGSFLLWGPDSCPEGAVPVKFYEADLRGRRRLSRLMLQCVVVQQLFREPEFRLGLDLTQVLGGLQGHLGMLILPPSAVSTTSYVTFDCSKDPWLTEAGNPKVFASFPDMTVLGQIIPVLESLRLAMLICS